MSSVAANRDAAAARREVDQAVGELLRAAPRPIYQMELCNGPALH